jgi:hypothetical protein
MLDIDTLFVALTFCLWRIIRPTKEDNPYPFGCKGELCLVIHAQG